MKCDYEGWCNHNAFHRRKEFNRHQILLSSKNHISSYFKGVINFHLLRSAKILSLSSFSSPSLSNLNSNVGRNRIWTLASLQSMTMVDLCKSPTFESFQHDPSEISQKTLKNPIFFNFYSVLVFNLFLEKMVYQLPEEMGFEQKFHLIQTGFTQESNSDFGFWLEDYI